MSSRYSTLTVLVLCLLVSLGAGEGDSSRGVLDPQDDDSMPNRIEFTATTPLTTVRGRFERWTVRDIAIDFEQLSQSFVEVEVDVASIATGAYRRDEHLRSEDFFEVEKFPKASVRIHDARALDGGGRYRAVFEVVVKGNRREVTGDFVVVDRDPLTVEGEVELDRVALGVGAPPRRFNPMSIHSRIALEFRAVLDGPIDVGPVESQP